MTYESILETENQRLNALVDTYAIRKLVNRTCITYYIGEFKIAMILFKSYNVTSRQYEGLALCGLGQKRLIKSIEEGERYFFKKLGIPLNMVHKQ